MRDPIQQMLHFLNELNGEWANTRARRVATGIFEAMEYVRAFHKKNDVGQTQRLTSLDEGDEELARVAATLSCEAERLQDNVDDDGRVLRAHLMCEELAELIGAMESRDEIKTLDALADLLYVVLGTAVTLDLPLHEAFIEVHTSNMTKTKQPADPHRERLRDKGPNYVAPNFAGVLKSYRLLQAGGHKMNDKECESCGMSWPQVMEQVDVYSRATCKGVRV